MNLKLQNAGEIRCNLRLTEPNSSLKVLLSYPTLDVLELAVTSGIYIYLTARIN